MKIEIIIPTYNNFKIIEKNLSQILQDLKDEGEIIITVVDDGSSEIEQTNLSLFIKKINLKTKIKIKLMLFDKNVGFSSNINRAALKSDSNFIVLLNSDVTPEKGFLKTLIPYFKNEKLFGIGMMDISIENDKKILRGRGLTYWKRGMFMHKRGEVDERSTSWISGGSSIIRTSLFKKIGGFDSIYNPFYWEDIDLSYVARKQGFSILFEPKSIVVHRHYEGSIKRTYSHFKIKEISYRNQFIFIWKNITDGDLILSHLFFLPFNILNALLRIDTAFLKGFVLAVFLLPVIIKKRRKIKKYFILKDKNIIP